MNNIEMFDSLKWGVGIICTLINAICTIISVFNKSKTKQYCKKCENIKTQIEKIATINQGPGSTVIGDNNSYLFLEQNKGSL